jgi:hypothetical protein
MRAFFSTRVKFKDVSKTPGDIVLYTRSQNVQEAKMK